MKNSGDLQVFTTPRTKKNVKKRAKKINKMPNLPRKCLERFRLKKSQAVEKCLKLMRP